MSSLLPPAGPPRLLAAQQLVSTVGDGIYYVTAALYFTQVVGLTPGTLGAGLTAAWAVGLVCGVPVGHLADRHGPRGVAIVLALGAAAAVSLYLFVHGLGPFFLGACLYTVCQRGLGSAGKAVLAGLIEPDKLVRVRAYIQSTYNFGLGIGAAIGGIALLIGTRTAYLAAFAIDAASFLGAALVLTRVPAVAPSPRARARGAALAVFRDRPFGLVSLINTVLVLHVPLIDVALPLWVVRHTAAPRWIIAALFALNTVMVVILQVRISRGVTGMASALRYVRRAGGLLFASCLLFAASARWIAGGSAWLAAVVILAAAALQALGEMAQFSGTWQISFGLAPADRQGQYQAYFDSGMTVAEMVGPLVLTGLLVYGGPPGWLALGAAFAAAGLVMDPAVRWAERNRPVRETAEVTG